MLQHNRMLATATVVMALVGVIFARLTSARADSQLFVYGGQKKARLQAEALEVVGDFQHPVTEDPSGSQESNLSIAYGIMIDAGSGSTKPTVW